MIINYSELQNPDDNTKLTRFFQKGKRIKHEMVEEEVYDRLEQTLQTFVQPTQEEQDERHESGVNTTWFGVSKEGDQSFLHYSERFNDIMCTTVNGDYTERFPQLVSFVGQTGVGKSTVINMLIAREQERTRQPKGFPAPVTGLTGDNIPTTGDVHLYSDPGTVNAQRPILYADCEGFTGGENPPRGLRRSKTNKSINDPQQLARKVSKLSNHLAWARDPKRQSREYAVMSLFPRILYTFSDVVVFVIREVRTFQTEVLQQLVKWAAMSIDKSINQPGMPHLVIVLNVTETTIDNGQWDPETATDGLLGDYESSVEQPKIETTKQLLEYYYSSIKVIRIPSQGIYMKMDDQVGKLHDIIYEKCTESHDHKRKIRMLLNAEMLPKYLDAAYKHFSKHLDVPFDFVEVASHYTSLPKNFGEHILNLILMMYNHHNRDSSDTPALLSRLSRPIASCVMLAATRDNTQGMYSNLLRSTYYEPIQKAFNEFYNYKLRCSYRKGNYHCVNVKMSHEKGHQAEKGLIFARGPFDPKFLPEDFCSTWINEIHGKIEALDQGLAGRDEKVLMPSLHKDVMAGFYTQSTSSMTNGSVSELKSYATCICCAQRIPEIPLPCGHILCKTCIQAYGEDMGQGWVDMHCCPLHPKETRWDIQGKSAHIRFKPQEAGVRLLCLDGLLAADLISSGGVRGIVELVILRAIEKKLGDHVPIQNFFDLIVGTSTGGIIALGLGVKRWRVSECTDRFRSLCKDAFTRRSAIKVLSAAAYKSVYKTKTIESALKSAFDNHSLLYGGYTPENAAEHEIRVAVTSSYASELRPVVLSNYNTGGERNALPYTLVRPLDPNTELKIWEAARATSAAPWYFKPFNHSKTTTSYMDGGIHHNCPTLVADCERRLIWEDVSSSPPDILLSVGNGLNKPEGISRSFGKPISSSSDKSHSWSLPRGKVVDNLSYLRHLASDIIENPLDCEKIWGKHCANATPPGREYTPDDKRRNIRLNVEFDDKRPELDDVKCLKEMEEVAENSMRVNPEILEVAHRLVASCFYFERTSDTFQNREIVGYHCIGNLRCRFKECSKDLKGLGYILRDCTRENFVPGFFIEENYGTPHQKNFKVPISTQSIDSMCHYGQFQVQMRLRIDAAYQDSITRVSIRLQSEHYRYDAASQDPIEGLLPISGFPRKL
ncbi:Fc.00g096420.m01.CDS01 [Cosmosporella sp. VM-42]